DHRVDRVFVRDLGVLLLDVGDPQTNETLPQIRHPPEESAAFGHDYAPLGSCSFGDSLTTRATASCPKNSRTSCTRNFCSLQALVSAYWEATCSSITCLPRLCSAFSFSSRA